MLLQLVRVLPFSFTSRRTLLSSTRTQIQPSNDYFLLTRIHQSRRNDEDNDWYDAHLAHGLNEVHEEDAVELLESEQAAAVDAHDAPDAGMEAAAEEWAVMLAAELTHTLKTQPQKEEQQQQKKKTREEEWYEAHLAHGLVEVHEEDADELLESKQAAAVDAHDAPDAGMEAAAEEWAVMLAAEVVHKLKAKPSQQQQKQQLTKNRQEDWYDEHLVHGAPHLREENADELLESEQAAANDAHDAPDAGVEAAAGERAVMLAAELAHKLKEESRQGQK